MLTILIPTKPDDTHAIYVKLALEKMGHAADLWYTADFPSQQTHSFEIRGKNISWHLKGVDYDGHDKKYDIVWHRRAAQPILPDILHPDDIVNAKKENRILFQTLWQVIQPDAVWVNPPNSVTRVNSKLLQLKIASAVGMTIPKTLISNNPQDIKRFLKMHAGNVIYKSLYPMAWLKKEEARLGYTSQVALSDLPSDAILQSIPGIFQEKIAKKYELRITYFGDDYVAVKINSQEHEKAIIDWRSAPTKELSLERVTIPDKLDRLCKKMMSEFNILFGCFDFIVTPEDDYYFLEINEQGQFLWIEDVNPTIKMLQCFVDFLIRCGHCEKINSRRVSLFDFEKEMMVIKKHAESIHKIPENF